VSILLATFQSDIEQVFYVKKAIKRIIEKGANVAAIIDLHGHSAKQVKSHVSHDI
jgi:hypothetical protein